MTDPQPMPTPDDSAEDLQPAEPPMAPPPWLRHAFDTLIEKKASDVLLLDIHRLSSIADHFVIASGTSDRHLRALADAIHKELLQDGKKPAFISGYGLGQWIAMDYLDAVIHLFEERTREHYRLERLWGKAPTVDRAD